MLCMGVCFFVWGCIVGGVCRYFYFLLWYIDWVKWIEMGVGGLGIGLFVCWVGVGGGGGSNSF